MQGQSRQMQGYNPYGTSLGGGLAVPAPKRVGQVEQSMADLDREVQAIAAAAENLMDSLSSVTSPTNKAQGKAGDVRDTVACPLAARIAGLTATLRNVRERIESADVQL